jgi:hypothetical protein
MMLARSMIALTALGITTAAVAAPMSMSAMKWQRRVLLVTAPNPSDPKIALQKRILDEWKQGAADRDMTLVEIKGGVVSGVSDDAASLRKRYRLSQTAFLAVLIGKDGHVAQRSLQPIDASTLERTVDAMPMRRNGQR